MGKHKNIRRRPWAEILDDDPEQRSEADDDDYKIVVVVDIVYNLLYTHVVPTLQGQARLVQNCIGR